MQVCTSLQTDNHTSTPPLSFLQAGCPSCRPTNSVKELKARRQQTEDWHSCRQTSLMTCYSAKFHLTTSVPFCTTDIFSTDTPGLQLYLHPHLHLGGCPKLLTETSNYRSITLLNSQQSAQHLTTQQHRHSWSHLLLSLQRQLPLPSFDSSTGVVVLLSASAAGGFTNLTPSSTDAASGFGDVTSDSESLVFLKMFFKPAVILKKSIQSKKQSAEQVTSDCTEMQWQNTYNTNYRQSFISLLHPSTTQMIRSCSNLPY